MSTQKTSPQEQQEEAQLALSLLDAKKKMEEREHHLRLKKLKGDVTVTILKIDLLKRTYEGKTDLILDKSQFSYKMQQFAYLQFLLTLFEMTIGNYTFKG